ncbi:MAG: exosome complex exonuclease Rrp41 [Candidatus Aenigmatarchaeota archaeon]
MTKVGAPEKMIEHGKRLDGRRLDEFRPLIAEAGMLEKACGSGRFEFANTKAIAAVYGPRKVHPRHMMQPQRAILRCKYSMAPFSTGERSRPGHSRRSIEISKVVTEALTSVMFLEDNPKTAIDAFVEIIQADASTRCAGLNATAIALADAGIPMRDLVASCSVGKVDGKIVLDVAGLEDNFGEVDMALATIGGSDRIVLLQLDGVITLEEFSDALDLAVRGCAEIHNLQKETLRKRYAANFGGEE